MSDLGSYLFKFWGIVLFVYVGESFIILFQSSWMMWIAIYSIMAVLMHASIKVSLKGTTEQEECWALFWLSALWTATTFVWLWILIDYFLEKIKSSKALFLFSKLDFSLQNGIKLIQGIAT